MGSRGAAACEALLTWPRSVALGPTPSWEAQLPGPISFCDL